MPRRHAFAALACLAVGAAASLVALPADAACTRASLQSAVDRYIAAQAMGDPDSLPLAPQAPYSENGLAVDLHRSLLTQPLKPEHQHGLLDLQQCEAVVQLASLAPERLVAAQLRIDDDVIRELRVVVVSPEDGPIDAAGFAQRALRVDWSLLTREHRSSREAMTAIAEGHLNSLPGGAVDRHFVIDPPTGAIAAIAAFGPKRRPGVVVLRIVDGRIEAVHSMLRP